MPIVFIAQLLFIFLVLQLLFNGSTTSHSFWETIRPWSFEKKLLLFALTLIPITFIFLISKVKSFAFAGEFARRCWFQVFTSYAIMCAALAILATHSEPTSIVAILAALFAAVGVAVQQRNTFNNQRKQHTMNVLLQLRTTELVHKHRINVAARFADKSTITDADVKQLLEEYYNPKEFEGYAGTPPKIPVSESVYYMSNYYEYIAAAIYTGDLDEELINETIGTHMRNWYHKYEAFIVHADNLNVKNGLPQRAVFVNLWWLLGKPSFRSPEMAKKIDSRRRSAGIR